jgi:kumamolisin
MLRCKRIRFASRIFGLLIAGALAGHAQNAVRLAGNIPPEVGNAVRLDRVDSKERIRFSILLPPQKEAEMRGLVQSIYTPGNPLYHHYLKTGEFAQRFGASPADYNAVAAFAAQQGLEVAQTHSNRLVLEVVGTVDNVEKAFGFHMMHYRRANGRVFHAPDAEPLIPASVAGKISGIVGLDDALEPKSNLMPPAAGQNGGSSGIGSGPNQGLSPSDIKTAYNLTGLSETGTGQTIALFELDGYLTNDIKAYQAYYNLQKIAVQNVAVDGVGNVISALTNSGPVEVTLDIELAMALVSNLTKILVYQGTNYVNIYSQIADDNLAQQVSTSWYSGRDIDVSSTLELGETFAYIQMALQGQTFYAASGDYGSNVKTGTTTNNTPILKFGVQDPSAQAYATGVGGTTLATVSPGGAYKSEVAWSGSGGGISAVFDLPDYQSFVISSGSGGSASLRNVPDVCLCSSGSSPYAIYYNGIWTTVSGTSCAAPLWAGFTALVNQRRAANGGGTLGFLNPTLYFLGNGLNYAADFYDIATGSNGTYAAVSHYDNCTGWGSFNGGALIKDLQVSANVLYVDGSYSGSTQNGQILTPYKTVTAAVNAASSSNPTLIYVRGNTYAETPTINKDVLIINNGGGDALVGP